MEWAVLAYETGPFHSGLALPDVFDVLSALPDVLDVLFDGLAHALCSLCVCRRLPRLSRCHPLPVVTSFYVTVKYLREVTPYFRKASIISEVGWELQRGFLCGTPPRPHSPQRADTRYLPLQLCYLVRNFRHPDPGFPRALSVKSTQQLLASSPRGRYPHQCLPSALFLFQDTLLPRRELVTCRAMLPLPNL
uniref:Uncharacterized protein n=1 Tax=Timema monikensis TaxID=170555 RepID=A0A7R9E443_9NEOP|nr:unnamed protein product [Timema monikensis]